MGKVRKSRLNTTPHCKDSSFEIDSLSFSTFETESEKQSDNRSVHRLPCSLSSLLLTGERIIYIRIADSLRFFVEVAADNIVLCAIQNRFRQSRKQA